MGHHACIAMILAGGRGERLGSLTEFASKPTVHFGGTYRIIDFTLSNCIHSGVEAIGILSQYMADELAQYISSVHEKELRNARSSIHLRPASENGGEYVGTADSIYKNMEFIDKYHPENVLILSGDHIYRMDYAEMLLSHMASGADVTIASTPVPAKDTHRYGILNADERMKITEFQEKPKVAKSNLASMGIYIFRWPVLKERLMMDRADETSQHDFGKNIITGMLRDGLNLFTYRFQGYWMDVGTVESLWQANMDLIGSYPRFALHHENWPLLSAGPSAPMYIADQRSISDSIICQDCDIRGDVNHSVLSSSVVVEEGAILNDSVVMEGARIGRNAVVDKAVIGPGAIIDAGSYIGDEGGLTTYLDGEICSHGVSLVAPNAYIPLGMRLQRQSHMAERGTMRKTHHPLEPANLNA